jgi:hypothetical protein
MFFGLTNSPATFQAMMNHIFHEEIREGWLVVYMDDLLIASDVQGPAQSPEAQAAQPLKPKPSRALWRALRAPRLGQGCRKPEPSLQAWAYTGW